MKKEILHSVAILWDIENITPPNSDTLLMDGITEFAEAFGRISASFAYADWSVLKFAKLSRSLSERQFKLTHTPHKGGNGGKGKNSADMALVSDAMELLQFYDHIDVFIVVTGDSDFRPLLQTMRKNGKIIHVIYDIKRAPQDLLALADGFTDYRDLISGRDEEEEEEDSSANVRQSHEYWFQQLAEAADILKIQGKSTAFSAVKIQMKMLNREFNESQLGFKRFSHFIMAAGRAGFVTIQSTESGSREVASRLNVKKGANAPGSLQMALTALSEELAKLDEVKIQEDSEHEGWHGYNHLGSLLSKRGINIQELGFSKLKKFIQNAEVRGVVETKIHEDGYPYVRRVRQDTR